MTLPSPALLPSPGTDTPDVTRSAVRLGPLRFPTLLAAPKEQFGDGLDAVGRVLTQPDSKPHAFELTLPVRVDGSPTPREAGMRLRRQLRALLANTAARLQGLWFSLDFDPELAGWLLVGSGDVEYAEGGPTFGEFTVSLGDCYRVGARRTHRPACRLDARDRRPASAAKDLLGDVFAADLSTLAAQTMVALPPGATALRTGRGAPIGAGSVALRQGRTTLVPLVVGQPDGTRVEFTADPAGTAGDVSVFSRTTPDLGA